MSFLSIPLFDDTANYTIRIQLDQIVYTLGFRFNTRLNTWVLRVADEFDVTILAGIPLLPGPALLDQFLSYAVPPGGLILFNTENNNIPPTQDTFSNIFDLIYNEVFA